MRMSEGKPLLQRWPSSWGPNDKDTESESLGQSEKMAMAERRWAGGSPPTVRKRRQVAVGARTRGWERGRAIGRGGGRPALRRAAALGSEGHRPIHSVKRRRPCHLRERGLARAKRRKGGQASQGRHDDAVLDEWHGTQTQMVSKCVLEAPSTYPLLVINHSCAATPDGTPHVLSALSSRPRLPRRLLIHASRTVRRRVITASTRAGCFSLCSDMQRRHLTQSASLPMQLLNADFWPNKTPTIKRQTQLSNWTEGVADWALNFWI